MYGIDTGSPVRSRPLSAWSTGELGDDSLAGTGYWGLTTQGGLLSPRKQRGSDVHATRRRGGGEPALF